MRSLLSLAGLVTALTILATVTLVSPRSLANPAFSLSLALFAISVGILFLPARTGRSNNSDATDIAAIGPVTILRTLAVVITLVSCFLAFLGFNTLAFALSILAVGGFVAGMLVTKAALNKVERVSYGEQNRSDHGKWYGRIHQLSTQSGDTETSSLLDALAEDARFAARDLKQEPRELSDAITSELDALSATVQRGDKQELNTRIQRVRSLLCERETNLKLKRSQI